MKNKTIKENNNPTSAFVGASWACLIIGLTGYLVGLWNAPSMLMNEKGYYFAVLILGLYSAVSLQKTVRDTNDGIPVTGIYYGITWLALIIGVLLLSVGLWNAELALSEKGFYAMAFVLTLFSAITVQKNVRDTAKLKTDDEYEDFDSGEDATES
jgi:uncharacterized membrane protein YiaA